MGSLDYGTDPEKLAAIAEQVRRVREVGTEVAEAVQAGGRPQPDPAVRQRADRKERPLTDSPGEQQVEKPAEDEPLTNAALVENGVLDAPTGSAEPAREEQKTEEPPPAEAPATTTGGPKNEQDTSEDSQ